MRARALSSRTAFTAIAVVATLAFSTLPAAAATDTEVTVGSVDDFFSGNNRTSPMVAINPLHENLLVAGANDNIDLENCNAGSDSTCPFTPGVGVTGIQYSIDAGTS